MMLAVHVTRDKKQSVTRAALLLVLLLLVGGLWTHAQVITGSFSGQVVDQSGAVVSNATVVLTNQLTSDHRQTTSNGVGLFTFAGVNPGSYTISVDAKGFKKYKQTDLTLTAGDSVKVPNIIMTVGSETESVEVSATLEPLVNTDNGERSVVIAEEDMERLSTESRNASELMKILPGVTSVANGTNNGLGFDFSNASSTGSAIGVGLSPNGAPYRGGTAYIMDGANIIDPGCNCWSLAVINPDMSQEVKIQTSNFGADSADGPVIFSAVSKAGGSHYHGEGYFYARHAVLNSNDWLNNFYGDARPNDHYYYPGGNIGGPVRLPFTDFNKNNKLLFWFGYEKYLQNLGGATTLESTIPTAGMMSGDFTANGSGNTGVCSTGFSSKNNNWCNDLTGAIAPDGTLITGGKIPAQYLDPGAQALAKLWPAANVDPSSHGGYNYYQQIAATHNGQTWRARIDYNLNENNKIFAAFQQGTDTTSTDTHMWWSPAYGVPYPGGVINNPTTSRVFTFNMLNILNPSLTNEFVFAWGFANSPDTPSDPQASYASTIGYKYGTIFNKSLVAPSVNGTQGLPDTSQPDIFSVGGGQYPSKKATPSFSDNVTKVWKQHTFKAGAFTQLVNNYQGSFVNYNGTYSFSNSVQADALTGTTIGSGNPTANFLMGISSGFTQTNSNPLSNLAYRTTSAFLMDDWKMTRRFTANLGFRMDHIGRWYDRSGVGLAVWLPGLYPSDVAAGTFPYPGVRWHGIDPGIPNSGSPDNIASTSPRLGLAYDIFGTGKTVLRGGWGMYRWNDQYNDYGGPLTTAQEMTTYNSPSNRNITFKDISALGTAGATGALGGLSGVADPTDLKIPTTTAYNMTISQQTPYRTVLEVAYVGNNTANLLMGGQSNGSGVAAGFINQNKIPVGGVFNPDPVTQAAAPADPDKQSSYTLNDYYPYYKGYGSNPINMATHVGYANYNALQIAWAKPTGSLTFNFNYTYQKALGILGNTVDAFTVHGNYGVLNIDRPQVFNSSYAYTAGRAYRGSSKLISGAANGWTISGTTTFQTGGNLQAQTTQNLGMSIKDTASNENLSTLTWFGTNQGEILPTMLCNPKSGLASHQLMNASCFGVPAVGAQGMRQFPYLSGPAYTNTDLTIYKPFHIREKQTVEFKAAAFNAFNHPLYEYNGGQYTSLSYSTADKSNFTNTSASGLAASTPTWGKMYFKEGRRIAELSVKYNF